MGDAGLEFLEMLGDAIFASDCKEQAQALAASFAAYRRIDGLLRPEIPRALRHARGEVLVSNNLRLQDREQRLVEFQLNPFYSVIMPDVPDEPGVARRYVAV